MLKNCRGLFVCNILNFHTGGYGGIPPISQKSAQLSFPPGESPTPTTIDFPHKIIDSPSIKG